MAKNQERRRKLVVNLALLAASLLLALSGLELTVRGLDLFPDARRAATEPRHEVPEGGAVIRTVIHPYLGWIKRPETAEIDRKATGASPPVNLLGFQSEIADYREVPEEDFAIGCFGGSVAAELCLKDGDLIVAELERRRPELAGRVRILNFASESYKQPQQFFALTMALLLGVPLDAAISLDGFNEVAMGGNGARWGHHPLWPARRALLRTLAFATGELSEEEILTAARILELRRRARGRSSLVSEMPLLRSLETAKALLGLLVLRDEAEATRLEESLQERDESRVADSLASLPDDCPERSARRGVDPICWELIADLWGESTSAMDALARRHGIAFLQLLQPSQYLPGSKPLSDEEIETAIDEHFRWGDYVREGYPVLRSRLVGLTADGVRARDLTGIFETHPETLYRDICCHLNRQGNEILAARIGELLAP